MQKILLINPYEPPSKRKGRKVSVKTSGVKQMAQRKKRRTAAQIAATRRLVAANKARRRVKRKANPTSRAAAYRAVPTLSNPIRKRRRTSASSASASIGRKTRVRRRSNPISPIKTTVDILKNSLGSSLWGAAGAVGVDVVAGMLPVPDMLKTGYPKYLFKGLLSGLAGVAAGYVVSKKSAADIAAGGLTVNLYGAMTELVKSVVPGVTLGYYNASLPATRANLGAYVSGTKGAGSALQSSAPGTNAIGAYVSGSRMHTGGKVRAIR